MSLKATLEKLAHGIVSHAKELVVTLHGQEKAKELLPELGSLLKKKVDEILPGA